MIEDLRRAMASHGLNYGGPLVADGRLRRIKVEGDRERNSCYVLYPDSPVAGAFGCWKRGLSESWHHRNGELSQADWNSIRERWQESERQRKQSEAEAQAQARQTAEWILENSSPVSSHGYLTRKNVNNCLQIRAYKGTLAIPLRDVYGTLHNVQFISADGTKKFLSGGRCGGAFFLIEGSGNSSLTPLVICEGFATGASIHQATGYSVACAMNAGNLLHVSKALRARWPDREIIIAGDDDQRTEGNPGVTKATEAAKEIGARLVTAKFADESTETGTDFNDLHKLAGIDEVKRQIDAALTVEIIPPSEKAKFLFDLQSRRESDPDELIKDRYLCRGGGLLLVAPTGVGKSAFGMQMQISFALGHECFGIRPARPLSSLLIQAENDEGDIAEMRDGVVHGLRLTPGQIEQARARTFIETEDAKTGAELIASVDRLLGIHKPDLLQIAPALAYLGGNASDQKDVGRFLRNQLNPVLHRHGCGCVIVHHTNKPASGKEKSDWQAGDFAYLGSGSGEWANWARAVLALRSIGSHDVYELRAGKRGARLGWKDAEGNTTYARLIGHSNEPGFIYWRDASEDELNQGGSPKQYNSDEVFDLLPPEGLAAEEWQQIAKKECGMSESTFHRERRKLAAAKRIHKSKVTNKWQPILKP